MEPAFVRELQGYSYTLRALRTEAIHDAPAHMLEGTRSKFRELENEDSDGNEDMDAKNADVEGDQEATNQNEPESKSNAKDDTQSAPPPIQKHSFDLPGDRVPAFPNSAAEGGAAAAGPSFISLWPDTFTLKYTPPFTFEDEIEACIRASVESLGRTIKVDLDGQSDDSSSQSTPPPPPADPNTNTNTIAGDTLNDQPSSISSPSDSPNPPPHKSSEFEITPEFLSAITQQITSTLQQSLTYISKDRYETTYYGSKNFVLPPSMSGKKVLKMLGRGKVIDKK